MVEVNFEHVARRQKVITPMMVNTDAEIIRNAKKMHIARTQNFLFCSALLVLPDIAFSSFPCE